VRHFAENLNLKGIAVFYQSDVYGFDELKGTEIAQLAESFNNMTFRLKTYKAELIFPA
jgi:hypothetical protein